MPEEHKDEKFVRYIIQEIVEFPDSVKVERRIDEMGVLVTVDVAPSDMGAVIGKAGTTAHAIRTLLRVIGAKNKARTNLRINEPEGSQFAKRSFDSAVAP